MIFGRPGGGKSTFAYALHKRTGIPLHHLDKHFYESNWVQRDYQIQQSMVQQEAWIIDGNSTKSLEISYKHADVVIYFNYPRHICYWRMFKRWLRKNKAIDDRAAGCTETINWGLLSYMWSFENRVKDSVAALKNAYPYVVFHEVHSDAELKKLYTNLD